MIETPATLRNSVAQERTKSIMSSPENETPLRPAFEVLNLSTWYGEKPAVRDVTIDIPSKTITAIIGPSGCGKSTFLRCLNRMHELIPRTRIEGKVLFQGEDLYSTGSDPTIVRRRIGMVFQKSNPFPTMSIAENVVIGLKLNGVRNRKLLDERLEQSLRMAALWDRSEERRVGKECRGGW